MTPRLGSYVPSTVVSRPGPGPLELFGLRSASELAADLGEVLRGLAARDRFQLDLSSTGHLRPELALPAYAGLAPADGLAPIFNLFDRVAGGTRYSQRVTKRRMRDFRGGRLSYDDHAGTDFVCPPATPLVAAAPGVVVGHRFRWLRGGLTVIVDHGEGVLTQYTHCSRALAPAGRPVRRGEAVALSGVSGIDMFQFAPWVPPHIHFTVFRDGRAIDPYLEPEEEEGRGTWLRRNDPRPSGPLPDDPERTEPSEVDAAALEEVAEACTDPRVRAEIAAARGDAPALAALLDDALLFDEWAWPAELRGARVRPEPDPGGGRRSLATALTLPLPAAQYRGAAFADTGATRPP